MAIAGQEVVFKITAAGNAGKEINKISKNIDRVKKKTKKFDIVDKKSVKIVKRVNTDLGRVGKTIDSVKKKAKELNKSLRESKLGRGAATVGRFGGKAANAGRGAASTGNPLGAFATLPLGIGAAIAGTAALADKYKQRVERGAATDKRIIGVDDRAGVFGLNQNSESIRTLAKAFGRETSTRLGTSIRAAYGNISAKAERKLASFQAANSSSGVASGNIRERAGNDIQKNILADIIEGFQGDYVARSLGLSSSFLEAFELGGRKGGATKSDRILRATENTNIAKDRNALKTTTAGAYEKILKESIETDRAMLKLMKGASVANDVLISAVNKGFEKMVKVLEAYAS